MASNRILLINEEIQKELSALLRTVKDPRVQDVMISITRVETTPDLRYTKVYVSFLQNEKAKEAMAGLKSAAGFLRRQLGSNLRLRYAPEIVWEEDDSITYGAKMLAALDQIEGDYLIRFMSSQPKDASHKLFDVMAASRHVARQLHLPVQSGCDLHDGRRRPVAREDSGRVPEYGLLRKSAHECGRHGLCGRRPGDGGAEGGQA